MSDRDQRTGADIREEIAAERKALEEAIQGIPDDMVGSPALRRHLPVLAVSAFAVGFAISGGIGATVRPLMRKRYEGRRKRRVVWSLDWTR